MKIGENIAISPFAKKQVKSKRSSVVHHLLLCNHSAFYDDFIILMQQNKRFLLELNDNLLLMRDKLSLNRNIILVPLYLLDHFC